MIKIRYTNNEDETTFVDGPKGTVMVCHNGCDYSIHTWHNHHHAFTTVAVNHAGEVMSAALAKAVEFVK